MIIPLYLLLFLFLMPFSNIYAQSCWADFMPSSAPKTFILAMGANTGDLKKANDDAQSFADAIQARFQVPSSQKCVETDITSLDFQWQLETLQQLVQRQDTVFIYFSGHGTTKPDDTGDELDCEDEVFVTNPVDIVTDDQFVKWVNRIKSHQIITFVDTCFASGMLRGEKGCPKRAKSKWFRLPFQIDETLPNSNCSVHRQLKRLKGILYAAAEEDKNAWEYPNKGGIFTYTFLEFMKKYPNANLDQIFRLTQKEVKEVTQNTACQQHPQRWGNQK